MHYTSPQKPSSAVRYWRAVMEPPECNSQQTSAERVAITVVITDLSPITRFETKGLGAQQSTAATATVSSATSSSKPPSPVKHNCIIISKASAQMPQQEHRAVQRPSHHPSVNEGPLQALTCCSLCTHAALDVRHHAACCRLVHVPALNLPVLLQDLHKASKTWGKPCIFLVLAQLELANSMYMPYTRYL